MLKLSANTGCSAHFGEPPCLNLTLRRQARRPRPIRSHRQGATSGLLRIPGALLRLATPIRRPAIIVFGLDSTGKSKAATFPAQQADLASKAARLMQLRLLKIDSPELAQFVAQLPVGKIYASGPGFVPQVSTDIYEQIGRANV